MNANFSTVRKEQINSLPKEASQVLELLEQIENHTANLRNKLMAELKSDSGIVRLKLDNIN